MSLPASWGGQGRRMVFWQELALPSQFLPNPLAQGLFQCLVLILIIRPQVVIYHGLIVAFALLVHLFPEPIQDVGINADGNANLARLKRSH
jgi:hypothetical protein